MLLQGPSPIHIGLFQRIFWCNAEQQSGCEQAVSRQTGGAHIGACLHAHPLSDAWVEKQGCWGSGATWKTDEGKDPLSEKFSELLISTYLSVADVKAIHVAKVIP